MTEPNRPTEHERREALLQMGLAADLLGDAVDARFRNRNEETERAVVLAQGADLAAWCRYQAVYIRIHHAGAEAAVSMLEYFDRTADIVTRLVQMAI